LEVDAKSLAAALPKPAPKSPGPVTSNNPNGKPILTLDQIKKMTPAEINKNWDVVQETLSSQSKVKS
jgi:hypothetical protein